MASTINASNGTTSGIITTGDNSGVLQLQTNNGTPALTLGTDQSATFAGSVSAAGGFIGVIAPTTNGTAGQVLVSDGTVNPDWTNQSTLSVGSATTATNIAGGGAGQVPYNTGSGATSFLAAGTSGQVLQSNGTSAPSWATPATGALTLVSTKTLTGLQSVEFTQLTGNAYTWVIENAVAGGSGNIQLVIGYGGATPTYITSNYSDLLSAVSSAGNITTYIQSNTAFPITFYINANTPLNGSGMINHLQTSSGNVGFLSQSSGFSTYTYNGIGSGYYPKSNAITALKFANTVGSNWTAGQISLYQLSQ